MGFPCPAFPPGYIRISHRTPAAPGFLSEPQDPLREQQAAVPLGEDHGIKTSCPAPTHTLWVIFWHSPSSRVSFYF